MIKEDIDRSGRYPYDEDGSILELLIVSGAVWGPLSCKKTDMILD